jgi:hypothetical protein
MFPDTIFISRQTAPNSVLLLPRFFLPFALSNPRANWQS